MTGCIPDWNDDLHIRIKISVIRSRGYRRVVTISVAHRLGSVAFVVAASVAAKALTNRLGRALPSASSHINHLHRRVIGRMRRRAERIARPAGGAKKHYCTHSVAAGDPWPRHQGPHPRSSARGEGPTSLAAHGPPQEGRRGQSGRAAARKCGWLPDRSVSPISRRTGIRRAVRRVGSVARSPR